MRQDIKDRWVAELRSGRHVQGTSALNKQGKKCCLGLLCELAVEDGVIGSHVDARYDATVYGHDLDTPITLGMGIPKSDQVLPDAVRDWAEVRTTTGYLNRRNEPWVRGRPMDLASANDSYGMDFNQIADLIEEHWETI